MDVMADAGGGDPAEGQGSGAYLQKHSTRLRWVHTTGIKSRVALGGGPGRALKGWHAGTGTLGGWSAVFMEQCAGWSGNSRD